MKADRIINIMLVVGYLMLLAMAYMSRIAVLYVFMTIFGIGAAGGILFLYLLRVVGKRNKKQV